MLDSNTVLHCIILHSATLREYSTAMYYIVLKYDDIYKTVLTYVELW